MDSTSDTMQSNAICFDDYETLDIFQKIPKDFRESIKDTLVLRNLAYALESDSPPPAIDWIVFPTDNPCEALYIETIFIKKRVTMIYDIVPVVQAS